MQGLMSSSDHMNEWSPPNLQTCRQIEMVVKEGDDREAASRSHAWTSSKCSLVVNLELASSQSLYCDLPNVARAAICHQDLLRLIKVDFYNEVYQLLGGGTTARAWLLLLVGT